MPNSRALKWWAALVLAPVLLAVALVALFGWNWLRGPMERVVTERTGRALSIQGDLSLQFAWPRPVVRANRVTFANPSWAQQPLMLNADTLAVTVDMAQLLRQKISLPSVRLVGATVFLEQGSEGRKSWLLDKAQQDEGSAVQIGRLEIDRGTLGYDDLTRKTRIRAALSTLETQGGATQAAVPAGLTMKAEGQYQGLAFKAAGSGGPVLALLDEGTAYPLSVEASFGQTRVVAKGPVTSLLKFSAADLQLALRGSNLAHLFPLLGMALPATPAYATEGRLVREANVWRYEKFSGRVGASDIAGSLQVATGAKTPVLTGELVSNLLDMDDLGPVIGLRPDSVAKAVAKPVAGERVLPDLPFNASRWRSVEADVKWRAKRIVRANALPLENLVTHLRLKDAVLTLAPLDFGMAGGHLTSSIVLDGRQSPIQAQARVRAQKISFAQLFPAAVLDKRSLGQINGEFNLRGQGSSVGQMLASANGKLGLVVTGGEVSKLMMEKAGLHLWEIFALNVTGDRSVKLRCAVADFDVKSGVMQTEALVFDTEITTILGTGSIDLKREQLNLTLKQSTKNTSPLALRSPIYVGGSFANPTVQVDKGRMAARAAGAVALGLVNPLLALIPLIDAGPGQDSDCGALVREAKAAPAADAKK